MVMQHNGKPEVVVITGASAGVGRATVREFARRGAHIGLLARGPDGLEGARHDAEALGGQAIALPTDVADPEQVEAAAAAVEEAFGPIDIWVNDAMTSVFAKVKDVQPEEFKRVIEVTHLGSVYGTMAALRRMLPRDRGVIVQVGSALAYRGIPLQAAYCAAKHATQGFFDSLRTELMHDNSNVKMTMVQLPGLNTPQFRWVKSCLPNKSRPVPPIFQPEIAARAIVWAAHHPRREVFVGWPTYKTIIGNKIAPGFADRVLAKQGISGQQTNEPADPNSPYNLWHPVEGDHGAHGAFDDRAVDSSWMLWAATNRELLASVAVGLVGLAGAMLWRKS
jgi:NAD(P)-dependent dehydrogenase (short-subunit alcohol dehydrogenase family)